MKRRSGETYGRTNETSNSGIQSLEKILYDLLTICFSIYVILNESEMVQIGSIIEPGVVLLNVTIVQYSDSSVREVFGDETKQVQKVECEYLHCLYALTMPAASAALVSEEKVEYSSKSRLKFSVGSVNTTSSYCSDTTGFFEFC